MRTKKIKAILVSIALGLTTVALSIVIYDKIQIYQRNKRYYEDAERFAEQEAKAARLKVFSKLNNIPDVNAKRAELKTKFINSEILYQFSLRSGKQRINLPTSFTVELLDKDNFIVSTIKIESSCLRRDSGEFGEANGYSCQGHGPFDPDKYLLVNKWQISWRN